MNNQTTTPRPTTSKTSFFHAGPLLFYLILGVMLCIAKTTAWGTTRTWSGTTSGNWSVASNWSPSGVPDPADQIIITNGTVTINTAVTISNELDWAGGAITGNGLLIASNAVLNISNGTNKYLGTDYYNPTITNLGKINVTCTNTLFFHSWNCVPSITNLGTICLQSDAAITNNKGAVIAYINNAGTVLKTNSTGTNNIGVVFNNYGTLDVESGGVQFTYSGNQETNNGIFYAANGSSISLSGRNICNSNSLYNGSGVITVNGSTTMSGSLTSSNLLIGAGGSWYATNLTIDGNVYWSSGLVYGPGFVLLNGATFNIVNGTDRYMGTDYCNVTITNFGKINVTCTNTWFFHSWNCVPSITNLGTICLQSDAAITNNKGATIAYINNAGTVLKTNSTGTNLIGVIFNNYGTLDVESGAVQFTYSSNYLGGKIIGNGLVLVGGSIGIHDCDITGTYGSSVTLTNSTFVGSNYLTGTLSLTNSTNMGALSIASTGQLYLMNGSFYGSGIVTNWGTILKTNGTGICYFNPGLVNYGTVKTTNGTLDFLNGLLLDGQFIALTNSTNQFGGGSFSYDGQASFTGDGQFKFTAGTFQLRDVITNLQLLGGTITLSSDFQTNGTIDHLNLNGCSLTGTNTVTGSLTFNSNFLTGALTLNGGATMNWTGGTLGAPLTILSNATLNLISTNTKTLTNYSIFNSGTINWTNSGNWVVSNTLASVDVISNGAGGVFNIQTDASMTRGSTYSGTIENHGKIIKTATSGTNFIAPDLENYGVVDIQSGTLRFTNSVIQYAGQTLLDGGELMLDVGMLVSSGVLTGTNTITGTVTNDATVTPGWPVGALQIIGDYIQTTNGTLRIALGGMIPGSDSALLAVGGSAEVAGAVTAVLTNGFYPEPEEVFTCLTAPDLEGSFATLVYNTNVVSMNVEYSPASASLVINNTLPSVTTSNLIVNECATLSLQLSATDDDDPEQQLTWTLLNGPSGLTLTTNGLLSWTPTLAQGPSTNSVTVVVRDNGTQPLSTTNTFLIYVTETNYPPVLPVQTNRAIYEQTLLVVTNTATPVDLTATNVSYSLLTAPTNAAIDTNGIISWTPSQNQSQNTYTFVTSATSYNPYAVNAIRAVSTNSFTVTVKEVNTAPTLPTQTNVTVNELTLLTVTNTATESDIHATLQYYLVGEPDGMVISTNGIITWTPAQTQSPSTNEITTIVINTVSNADQTHLMAMNSFTVIVREVNVAPVLPTQTNVTVNELSTLTVTNTATESNIHSTLGYVLVDPPSGAVMDTNGVITWTPTEAQGPGVYTLTTIVTNSNPYDSENPHLSATNSFVITVNEVNSAPVFSTLLRTNWTVNPGVTVTVTNSATDGDLPAQTLTCQLASGPSGATVNSTTGIFSWRPPLAKAGSTNLVAVVVYDSGTPSLSATQYFQITVNEVSQPTITAIQCPSAHSTLTITGPVGPDYVIEASTNLSVWQSIDTNSAPASLPFQWTDTNSQVMRFYRIQLSP